MANAACACGGASRYSRSISARAAHAPSASIAAHRVFTRYSNDATSGFVPTSRMVAKHRSAVAWSACRTQLRRRVLNVLAFGSTPARRISSTTFAASSRKPSWARPLTRTVYVTSFGWTPAASMSLQVRRARSSSPTRTHALSMFVYVYTLRSSPASATRRNASSAKPSCLSLPKSLTRRLKNLISPSFTARFSSVCASRARLRFAFMFRIMPSSSAARAE